MTCSYLNRTCTTRMHRLRGKWPKAGQIFVLCRCALPGATGIRSCTFLLLLLLRVLFDDILRRLGPLTGTFLGHCCFSGTRASSRGYCGSSVRTMLQDDLHSHTATRTWGLGTEQKNSKQYNLTRIECTVNSDVRCWQEERSDTEQSIAQ